MSNIFQNTVKTNDIGNNKAEFQTKEDAMGLNNYNEEIAIIGIGCRFPGNAANPEKFWELLISGQDGIVDVPEGRWDVKRFCDQDANQAGRLYVNRGGFLQHDIREFDPMFFGISPREADFLDPQQRLLLEVAWESIDNAGLDADQLIASNTGVFIGGFMMDSMITQLSPLNRDSIGSHTAVGFTLAMLANRLSHSFDLRGPSIALDTACSGSLVATHLACNGIWNGDCDIALVGGVNLMHRPEVMMAMCKGKFLAKDGRSKSFDERGDGYGRGEGAGVVVLKRKSAAIAAGDRIYATIRATGCNQDGHTDGITVPNPDSQADLIRKVCAKAGAIASDIRVFEAHGTGTAVGDPLEASALGQVVGKNRAGGEACIVGSVKANIGHLEAAAGIAAVIKIALTLHHGVVPPLANLKTPNPAIPFDQLGLRLTVQPEAIPDDGRPYLAGVNSFGYGGTNAHVLMQPYRNNSSKPSCEAATQYLMVASARDTNALKAYVAALRNTIAGHTAQDFPDLVYSSARRRTHHSHRLTLVTNGRDHALEHLDAWLTQGFDDAVSDGQAPTHTTVSPVFVYTGMGPQWWRMGRDLYRDEAVFREFVDRCDQIFQEVAGWSILEQMQAEEASSKMGETQIAQPANFIIQAALTELLKSKGVYPAAIVGHSVGEVTAAYVAGCYGLRDALKISHHRSRIQKKAAGQGGMLALGCSEKDALKVLAPYSNVVSIAAINSPGSVTLAGDSDALARIAEHVTTLGWFNKLLQVEVPYHSPAMEPLKAETRECLADLQISAPQIALYSTVRGTKVEDAIHDAEYWCDNIREAVLFADAITALVEDGHKLFLEVGPHPVLSTSMKQIFSASGTEAKLVASMRRGEDESNVFAKAMGALYSNGCRLDWAAIYPNGKFLELPGYPWQREIHWNETDAGRIDRLGATIHPLLQRPIDAPGHVWESSLNARFLPFIMDHQVQGLVLLPGAAYVETALAVHQASFAGGPCLLEDVAFRRALVVDSADESNLRIETGESGGFKIYSRRRNDKAPWDLNSEGRISMQVPKHAASFDHESELASCNQSKSKADHYEEMAQRGLYYGPAFQGIAELRFGDGVVMARVIETVPDGGTWLNPTKLDACFQALLTIMPADSGTFLPTGIRKVIYRRQPGSEFWCHGRIRHTTSDWLEADLRLYDAQGAIAEIIGLRCQALPNTLSQQGDITRDWTYSQTWESVETPKRTLDQAHFLVAGLDDSASPLVAALKQASGIRVTPLCFGEKVCSVETRADYLLAELARLAGANVDEETPYHGIVFDLGTSADWQQPETGPVVLLLRVIQSLVGLVQTMTPCPRIYLLTRNAQAVASADGPVPAWGALIGLMRVVGTEYPMLRPCVVDLGVEDDVQFAVGELLADTAEDCSAWRGGVRYVQRLTHLLLEDARGEIDTSVAIEQDTHFELHLADPKQLDSFTPVMGERGSIGPLQVEIRVDACTVLPKDLSALTHAGQAGSVAAGTVVRIGGEVSGISVGDRLVVCAAKTLRRHFVFDPALTYTMPIPALMSAAQAVVAPLPFIIAMHSVEQLGCLQSEETVLIHHTADGMSLAAMQLARQKGARVIVVVQSDAAATQLSGMVETINIEHEDLETAVRALTNGRGVDLVIDAHNKLADLDIAVLAEFGRMVSIAGGAAQRGVTPGGMANRPDISLLVSDVSNLLVARPNWVRKMLDLLASRLASAEYQPLPQRTFGLDQLSAVLPAVDDANGVGCIAIDLSAPGQARAESLQSQKPFRKDGSYLITGAFGGFGQELARWMAQGGAGELILLSRRGEADPAAANLRRDLENLGSRVSIHAVDVANPDQVAEVVRQTGLPNRFALCGVMHTAAVLDDAPLLELDAERFERVFAAKVRGAWNLHHATQHLNLEHFILFSSISALIGNASQGNYVAANCILDNLAHYRRRKGLTACSINWGALGDVGMAASSSTLESYLESIGMHPFSAADALTVLGRVLTTDQPQVGILSMDWQRWKLAAAATAALPRFSKVVSAESTSHLDPEVQARYDALAALPEEERLAWACNHMVMTIAKVMRLPVDRVKPELSLPNLGVDSLMNMELVVTLQRELAIEIGALELLQGGSLQHIANLILSRMSSSLTDSAKEPEQSAPASAPSTAPANLQEEVLLENLGSLNDDELDKLLESLR
jgi:acyl transferase domain-containing protein/NADP-dependent 3-hydroxy acid dehydrogenase YdfG/acyl carrier protein